MHTHEHHHNHAATRYSRTLIICAAVNLLYVAIEAIVGLSSGSAGLLADAGHNLSDVLTLLLSLAAIAISASHPRCSYLLSVTNALLLMAAAIGICAEGVIKIINPEPIEGGIISITAGIGILVNGITAWLLMKDSGEDINIKASFLHMLSDTLVSVGVVISGLIISSTGCYIIDPVISIAISVIIFILSVKLVRECLEKR